MNSIWMKILLPILVIGIGTGSYYLVNANKKEPEEKKVTDFRPTVLIQTMKAESYTTTIKSHGELKPLEQTQLAAQVSGEVISWHPDFVPGGLIKQGEVLFRIKPDDYEAAVLQAEAQLVQAEAALIEEEARAKVAQDEVRRLKDKSRADLFLRKPQLLSAKAAVNSAKAALMSARRNLANCDVKAPYDALVISREIGIGQFVNVGMSVALLNNINSAEVMIPIAGFDQAFLPSEIQNTEVTVRTSNGQPITRKGVIARDLGVVDNATRMSYLVIRVEDPYGLNNNQVPLKFGTYVEVSFDGQILENVYKLDQDIVNKKTVWVVDSDMKLAAKKVAIAREEGMYFLISEGLDNNDRVLTTLPEHPQQGMEVKFSKAEADS